MKDLRKTPYVIAELANVHGGDISIIENLIERFASLKYKKKGIKFQIFAPDKIALSDFSWYEVYKELYIDSVQWRMLLRKAKVAGDVWLDIFDAYGVEVLSENMEIVSGIKLQASVVNNYEVRAALKNLDFRAKSIILNVSGLDVSEAQKSVSYFEEYFEKVIVQFGFQSYPTKVEDTGRGSYFLPLLALHPIPYVYE